MTTEQTPSSPGFLATAWERKWLVLIPVAVSLATTFVATRLYMEPRYESATSILVVPQRVPEQFVRSTVKQTIHERMQTISQTVLSRTRLERIIKEFNMYPDERTTGIMEEIVQNMASNVKMEVLAGDAMRVSFTYANPIVAQKVAEKLGSLFIEESTRDREIVAEGTDQFLEAQVEDAGNLLMKHESRLAEFRDKNPGRLLPRTMVLQREVLEESYKALLTKREESRIGANLERRQVGEQFRIVDPARLPQAPLGPSQARVNVMGGLAGLSVGLVLAIVSGVRRRSRA